MNVRKVPLKIECATAAAAESTIKSTYKQHRPRQRLARTSGHKKASIVSTFTTQNLQTKSIINVLFSHVCAQMNEWTGGDGGDCCCYSYWMGNRQPVEHRIGITESVLCCPFSLFSSISFLLMHSWDLKSARAHALKMAWEHLSIPHKSCTFSI